MVRNDISRRRLWALAGSAGLHAGLVYLAVLASSPRKLNDVVIIPVSVLEDDTAEPEPDPIVTTLPEAQEQIPEADPVEPSPPLERMPPSVPEVGGSQTDRASLPDEPDTNVAEGEEATPYTSGRLDIDPAWRVDPQAGGTGAPLVGGLGPALDCLKGFEEDCSDQRRQVFAEQQLSETDKVWMPTFAHSGLSDPRFVGMSEREIRGELGVAIAGENGWYIPFSPVGISSYWTDPLYGVNKRCRAVVGKNPFENKLGETEMVQDCPALRKAQGDLPSWRREWEPGGADPDPADWAKKKKPG
ncbi:hypothetical protein [uncultured Algimonas sp.]|uniref:hypothetical protein n=1 Tax=uncultured Algimonas sp. TaxID=1547920 RepID=UPI00262CABC4|nr:hypothetical protein [uncultured Algimonas sp.]